ncbi:MAG: mechanosensitive ion channel [Parvularculaceae bacterium]
MQMSEPTETQETPPSGPSLQDGALDELIGVDSLRTQIYEFIARAREQFLSIDVGVQFAVIAFALFVGGFAAPQIKKLIARTLEPHAAAGVARRSVTALRLLSGPIISFVLLHAGSVAAQAAGYGRGWIDAAISLMTAWIAIRLVTLIIRSPTWSRLVFFIAWPIAALDILGLLGPLVQYMDSAAIPFGSGENAFRLSALTILRAIFAFALLLWVASQLSSFLERRISKIGELTPSLQVLIIQLLKILLPALAFLIALALVGVDLTALTVFSGAIGLGIGLGMQRTVSNLVSGFTLIMDKSIKPGDVIAIDNTFGWVTSLGARYVAIRTRDGTEHLMPNDQFITNGVENWSHQDRAIRIKIGVGISYASDLHKAIALCIEAAKETERVLATPQPLCHLIEFADSALSLELRIWINDPQNGVANVKSAVMLKIWDKFKDAGIEIPFPQRDLHIRSGRLTQPGQAAAAD